uniref:BTB domain-containing protein n=1 Tax=Branchiostoma floridae TaxID=7739 RepID=C3YYP3_BRAFL|eukprot:XP_002598671.1 hypothetical protein BRAFLDRAFT_67078 [Branchiostoma floridae]
MCRCGSTLLRNGMLQIFKQINMDTRPKASPDVCHDTHSTALLWGLQELRSENLLVDVVLCVSEKEIPCHRNVLAACSGYFRSMFCNGYRENNEHKVTIHEASDSIVQLLVDYAYTSKVTITDDNAVDLSEGASFFQFQPVRDACTKFLCDTLCVTNCLERLNVGNMLMDHHLESTALSYVMKEFSAASQTPDFLDLTKELLITIISSDDLNAPEEIVYASVMKWIRHAPRKREKEMRELVGLVRFPWMDKLYFIQKVQSDKILCKCCPDIVSEALKYQAYPGEVQSPRTRPRRASGLREAVVVIGGTERFAHGNPPIYSNDIMMTHSSTPSNTTWGSMTTMKRSNDLGFAVAVWGTSEIMVPVGGLQCRDVWLYQARLDCWSNLAPINTARIYHKMAVVQGKVYAIGGIISFSPRRVTAAVEVYDRSLNK